MKMRIYIPFLGAICMINAYLYGQGDTNCFLYDHEPKTAVIPEAVEAVKPTERPSVKVSFQGDTIGKISRYVFGNAIAAWAGAHDNPALVEGIGRLAPTLIRFPGGSWSNGYFWNGAPTDVPDSIYDGTTYNGITKTAKKNKFWGQPGKGGWQTTTDQYYALREARNTLTQRPFADYDQSLPTIGVTKLETDHMKDGDIAGLAIFQDPYAFIAVKHEPGTKQIIMVNNGETIASAPIKGNAVYLRTIASNSSGKATFEYGFNNKTFTCLGNELSMKFNLTVFTGNKFCLFNYATKTSGGYVDFDWFRSEVCLP